MGIRVAVGRSPQSGEQILAVTGDFGNYNIHSVNSANAGQLGFGNLVQSISLVEENATFSGKTTVAVQNAILANQLTLTSNKAGSLSIGEIATITATITETSDLLPRGFVTFTVDGVAQAPVAVVNNKASVNVSKSAVGNIVVTAKYSGDANFGDSVSTEFTQAVAKSNSTTTVTAPSTSVFNQSITISAAISSGGSTATGTVVFKIDGVAKPAVSVVSGGASLTLPAGSLSVGSHTIVAEYSGDANLNSSVSTTASITIGKAPSSITLSSPSAVVNFGQAVSLAVAVSPLQTVGTVTIKDGLTVLGTQPVSSLNTFAFTFNGGVKQLVAEFSGNDSYLASSSIGLQVRVNKATPAVSLVSWKRHLT